MAEKNEKKINIYKVAGKVGKRVRMYGGYVLAITGVFLVSQVSDFFKKDKN